MRLKLKRRSFSGYSKSISSRTSYIPIQVFDDYILEPIDKSLDYIESVPVEPVKNKVGRFSRPFRSIKNYINYRKNNTKIDK